MGVDMEMETETEWSEGVRGCGMRTCRSPSRMGLEQERERGGGGDASRVYPRGDDQSSYALCA